MPSLPHLAPSTLGAACLLALANAHAQVPTQSAITAPGGFVSACAGSNHGAGFVIGSDLTALYGAANCASDFFAGAGTATADRSSTATLVANQTLGITGLGAIHMSASNSAPSSASFPAAASNGGWKDTLMVDAPGLTGQAGIMTGAVNVNGFLEAHGPAGSASFSITAYKDNAELMRNVFGFDGGSQATTGATDRQRVSWGIASFSNNVTMTVNDTVVFAVPIVFGQSFTLGVYGLASAGMRSQGSSSLISTAALDFLHSATWGGVTAVYGPGNVATAGFTVTSASGTDWTLATPVPEPGAWALMLGGLGVVAGLARRRRPDTGLR